MNLRFLIICSLLHFALNFSAQNISEANIYLKDAIELIGKDQFETAEHLIDKSINIYEINAYTKRHEYGTLLTLKTLCLYKLNKANEAYSWGGKAYDFKIGNEIFDGDFGLILTLMKNICQELEKAEEEIQWAEEILKVKKQRMTIDPDGYTKAIRDLASTYFDYQLYAKARPLFMEFYIKSIAYGSFDYKNEKDISILFKIGMSSFYLCDYDFAIELFHEFILALDKLEKNYYGDKSIAHCYLAECYLQQGYRSLAKSELEAAKELNKEYNQTGKLVLLLTLYIENLILTEENPQAALSAWGEIYPEGDGNFYNRVLYARIKKNAGICAMLANEYDLAKKTLVDAIDFMERYEIYGGDDYYDALYNLMLVFAMTEEIDDVAILSSEINDLITNKIYNNFPLMSENVRTLYWKRYNSWFSFLLPQLAVHFGNNNLKNDAYRGLMLSKGMLLRSAISIQDYILRTRDENLIELQQQVMFLKKKLQRLQQSNEAGSNEFFQTYINIERLQQRILNGIENNFMSDIFIDVDSIRNVLKQDDVAIEFFSLQKNKDDNIEFVEDTVFADTVLVEDELLLTEDSIACDYLSSCSSKKYYALVLRCNYDSPHLIELCDEQQLQDAIYDSNGVNKDLYSAVWEPLEKELKGCSRVFFSADGLLHNLPIEYCPINKQKSFSEQYVCYRLSSTRTLVMHKNSLDITGNAIIYGDIDYDNNHKAPPIQDSKDNVHDSFRSSWIYRGASDVQNKSFHRLRFAKQEIDGINLVLRENKYEDTIKKDAEATEESFKSISGHSPSIIHLCTHGYFIPQNHEDWETTLPTDDENAEYMTEEDEAMSRCGLIMAGANQYLFEDEKDNTNEDGFLTARELARMDLSGTNLVAMSACETGLGDISSEGVFGLQRGFKKAGANSILMSLWKVDDEATCKLMTEFYSNWIGKKMTKHDALEAAKKTVRETKEEWEDPKYWAAFILLDGLD